MARGIEQHGNSIRIRIYHQGREYRTSVEGNILASSDLAAACKLRDQLRARLKLGLSITESELSDNPTFIEAAQEYLNNLDVEYSTSISYENIINNIWLPAYKNRLLNDISSRDIRVPINAMKRSPKTKRNYLIPLRGIFDHFDIIPNPAHIKIKAKKQKAPIERFSPTEREIILSKLSGENLLYFSILFGTGMRPGEVLALEWSDYTNNQFYVYKSIVRRRLKPSTKNHESRKVYIPEWVRDVLDQHYTRFGGGYILLNTIGGPHLDSDKFNAAWRSVFDSHEIKRKHRMAYRIPYTCRHSRAAELLSTGVAPGDAANQLGHSLEMFYRVYSEWIDAYAGESDLSRFEGANRPKTAQKEEKLL